MPPPRRSSTGIAAPGGGAGAGRSPAAPRAAPASGAGAGPLRVPAARVEHRDRPRVGGGRAAQDQARLDRALPGVALEPHHRVEHAVGSLGQRGAAEGDTAGAGGAGLEREAQVLALAHRPGSARRAAGTSSATSGLAVPKGARRPSSSASSSPSSSPATTASTRCTGTRSSAESTLPRGPRTRRAARRARPAPPCSPRPRDARRGGGGARRRRPGRPAGRRPGWSGPSPSPGRRRGR